MKSNQIFVESEFAPLKRVVLAQSQFSLPARINKETEQFLTEDSLKALEGAEGKDIADAFPALQNKWEVEKENFEKILQKYKVEILRPRLLTKEEKVEGKEDGYSNFFARDPFFVIGQMIIEGSMKLGHRKKK